MTTISGFRSQLFRAANEVHELTPLQAQQLLEGAVANFECFNRSQYAEGDHVIFVGEVERCGHRPGAAPLLYHGGRFYTEHPLL